MPTQKKLNIFRRDVNGGDILESIQVKYGGRTLFDPFGNAFNVPANTTIDNFELIPATALAAGKNPFFLIAGTGTEAIARATKGGINIQSQPTTPATGDNVFLAAVAETGMAGLMNAKSLLRCSGVFGFPVDPTATFGFVGLEQNASDADPSGTAGDGACICWATGPSAMTVATGLSQAVHDNNFILHWKVAGADVFRDTGVRRVTGLDYHFAVEIDDQRKARFWIDSKPIVDAAGAVIVSDALTDATTLRTFAGLELTAGGTVRQMDLRYLMLERTVG